MARKNILHGLLNPSPAPAPAATADAPPRSSRGAIGAVSRSIADLKARSVIELDPMLIDAGGMQDRLESDSIADNSLKASMAEYGQQVPVLVRPHPERDGRYQIVYGRRRVLAMRDLGQPVKALLRDLDDRELILAQGQENTARRDLSFIEKVNFARQLQEAGYDRKVISDALTIDKTLLSRMLSVAEKVPADAIAAIGAAPSVGRDRWLALAEMIETTETDAEELLAMINLSGAIRSDERFQSGWNYLAGQIAGAKSSPSKPPARTRAASLALTDTAGRTLGQIKRDQSFLTVKLRLSQTDGFEDWLVENLPILFDDWLRKSPRDQ